MRRFRDKDTETIWSGHYTRGFSHDIQKRAYKKLQFLMAAKKLQDLRFPPGNNLEALKGNRKGQHSIRVNDQYRLCFIWTDEGPVMIELTDYH